MSPHHRRIVPAMAARYGFDYAFVTYKWPHWLHKQTDKQRIIWRAVPQRRPRPAAALAEGAAGRAFAVGFGSCVSEAY
jgi:hypothetical protein